MANPAVNILKCYQCPVPTAAFIQSCCTPTSAYLHTSAHQCLFGEELLAVLHEKPFTAGGLCSSRFHTNSLCIQLTKPFSSLCSLDLTPNLTPCHSQPHPLPLLTSPLVTPTPTLCQCRTPTCGLDLMCASGSQTCPTSTLLWLSRAPAGLTQTALPSWSCRSALLSFDS